MNLIKRVLLIPNPRVDLRRFYSDAPSAIIASYLEVVQQNLFVLTDCSDEERSGLRIDQYVLWNQNSDLAGIVGKALRFTRLCRGGTERHHRLAAGTMICMARHRLDVAVVHTSRMDWAGELARLLQYFGKQTVVYHHTAEDHLCGERTMLTLCKECLGHIFVSEVASRRFVETAGCLGRRELRYGVIPNGVDVNVFAPVTLEGVVAGRQRLGIAPGARVLGVFGRLLPRKGILLSALIGLEVQRGLYGGVVLLVAGEGPCEKELQVLASSLNGNALRGGFEVRMVGRLHHTQVREVIGLCDAVLICSVEEESCPMVALEAQACGVPVVAFDVGGMKEAVVGENIVPRGDVRAMIERVAMLLGCPAALEEMRRKAREHAVERFTKERMCEDFINLMNLWTGENGTKA